MSRDRPGRDQVSRDAVSQQPGHDRGAPASDPGREAWRATVRAKALGQAPERRERFETSSGIEIADLYTQADVAGLDEERDLGRPGEFPFTRGV